MKTLAQLNEEVWEEYEKTKKLVRRIYPDCDEDDGSFLQ